VESDVEFRRKKVEIGGIRIFIEFHANKGRKEASSECFVRTALPSGSLDPSPNERAASQNNN
jgi:hypothetical protein